VGGGFRVRDLSENPHPAEEVVVTAAAVRVAIAFIDRSTYCNTETHQREVGE
jgi:hypothetical protein